MEPVAYSVSDVIKMVGISRTKFYELVRAGEIKVRKVGTRSIISIGDLNAWLDSLPIYPSKGAE